MGITAIEFQLICDDCKKSTYVSGGVLEQMPRYESWQKWIECDKHRPPYDWVVDEAGCPYEGEWAVFCPDCFERKLSVRRLNWERLEIGLKKEGKPND